MELGNELSLPADTLKILNEFLAEKQKRDSAEAVSIKEKCGKDINFEENWQLSQFWYSGKTKSDITKLCKNLIANDDTKIGLFSCPSLYTSIKETHKNVKIFEYDKRFESYGADFILYDFNNGEDPQYLLNYHRHFDILIVDPPFLSEDCIRKTSLIINNLRKDTAKIVFCSGEVVEQWIVKFLQLRKCNYKPEHERNLGNEFVSYANFNLDEFL